MLLTTSNNKPNLNPPHSWQFEAIGTSWSVLLYQPLDAALADGLAAALRRRIDEFDLAYSRFRPDSIVTAMSQAAGTYRLPADAAPMIELYRRLYELTDGSVTPLIGQTLADAGYDAKYSLQPGKVKSPAAWDEVMQYRPPELQLRSPALLDFGAAGKGHLVDIVSQLLEAGGVYEYCVDAGGDLRYRTAGRNRLPVALEHPADPTMAIGLARLGNASICGSAGNRRAWDKYHHIIDPAALESPRHIRAVWAVASTTLLADGLTTALYFVPAKRLLDNFVFEYAIIYEDYRLEHSPDFPAEFFTS